MLSHACATLIESNHRTPCSASNSRFTHPAMPLNFARNSVNTSVMHGNHVFKELFRHDTHELLLGPPISSQVCISPQPFSQDSTISVAPTDNSNGVATSGKETKGPPRLEHILRY